MTLKKSWRIFSLTLPFTTFLMSCTHLTQSEPIVMQPPSAEKIAQALELSGHIEGGYYRRTYQADDRELISTESGDRFLMTSIYYMLTRASPIGHFHLNKSDIMHYYHVGDPIRYTLIHPNGKLETVIMGNNVLQGHLLQLHVKGGVWKASELLTGNHGYGLISETVTPGFDFADMTIGQKALLNALFPQHQSVFEGMTKE